MKKRRSLRLPGYNYQDNSVYFVTVCTHRKHCLFGAVVDGLMIPNELGRIVKEEWLRAEKVRSNVEMDMYVLMPNHLHGVIMIRDEQEQTHKLTDAQAVAHSSMTLQSGSLGAIIGQFKSIVTKRIRRLPSPPNHPIWQRNYYESVIRTHEVWNRAREYIAANPMRWREDSLYVV